MCREPMRWSAMGTAERSDAGASVAAAARDHLGQPFRPQGRGIGGFDCLGLVLAATKCAGFRQEVPALAMRGHAAADVCRWLAEAGLAEVALAHAAAGDILLGFPATRQAHLAVRTERGFVEASALVRRVVERPWNGGAGWHSAWRLP